MVTAAEVRKLAERLAKAEQIVAAGGVHRIDGLEGYYAVASSHDAMYLVHLKNDGSACCSCPDFQHRQGKAGEGCKHIYAAEITRTDEHLSERAMDEAGTFKARPVEEPAATPAPVRIDGRAALARLQAVEDDEPFGGQAAD